MILALSSLCFLLLLGLIWSVRKNLEFSEKLETVVDQVENSLDILDSCYNRAAARARLEVLSDEPIVKELLDDIQVSRDAILIVANLIVEPLQNEEDKGS